MTIIQGAVTSCAMSQAHSNKKGGNQKIMKKFKNDKRSDLVIRPSNYYYDFKICYLVVNM